ncbi:MAG: adaptor protein MecA [Clostridia bacterium]|nr:adaptor protein MecA [Clostridia bacterium]MDD4048380.1 adaptor protein MecA [Clostridia bacterium]
MKIKRISDNKVQIIITNKDLEEREFKKWELMPLSPKVQELFQDLLDMAYQECGFEIEEDSQLIVEAYPLSADSFAIIMTKTSSGHESEHGGGIPSWCNENCCEEDDELDFTRENRQVWCFDDLELCMQACARVVPDYIETSALYKCSDQYYLAVTTVTLENEDVAAILGEYGEWIATDISYFEEYGKVIIQREAVVNLASMIKYK